MRLRTLLVSVALAALGLAPMVGVAHGKPGQKALKEADGHFKRGIQLVDETSYQAALAEFEEAYTLAPHPLVLFNIAGAHRALKHYREALDAYSRFLLEGDGVVKAELLARGKSDMDALLALLGRVELDSRPKGAQIFVDGEDLGATPVMERLVLPPGSHEIEARLAGYKTETRILRVSAGDELELTLELVSLQEGGSESQMQESQLSLGARREPTPSRGDLSLSASFGSNMLRLSTTGAPTLGAAYDISDRVSLGLDVVLVAYSAIPQIRFRLVGDALSMHLIAALPLSISTGMQAEFFAAAAGGAGIRYALHDKLGLRLEALASYAGSVRGLTLPAFAGAELFF